jgi:hypothetical protein
MKKIFFLFLFVSSSVFSQRENYFLNLIDSVKIIGHVAVLAHDSLQGRNTGEEGQKKAAHYIQKEFRKLKMDSLTDGYFQKFVLNDNQIGAPLKFNKVILSPQVDFASFSDLSDFSFSTKKIKSISYSDFKELELIPFKEVIISNVKFKDINMDLIRNSNIEFVFILIDDFNPAVFEVDKLYNAIKNEWKQKIIYIDSKKIKQVKKKNSLSIDNKILDKRVETENVIAYIPGSDSKLKEEYIVISAHYDHLGIKNEKVFNGADDNASGTAALLELARVYKEAQKTNEQGKRSILFICFTGEEHGLLGSEYYATNPLIALNKTVANFNIDMIGRKDKDVEKEKFSVYAIGSDKISMDFHHHHEAVVKSFGKLNIDYTYNDPKNKERLYYRSDHYNFAKNGIPSIFYFGGFHEDYHKITDDIEKLNFTKIATISQLVFLTSYRILNL